MINNVKSFIKIFTILVGLGSFLVLFYWFSLGYTNPGKPITLIFNDVTSTSFVPPIFLGAFLIMLVGLGFHIKDLFVFKQQAENPKEKVELEEPVKKIKIQKTSKTIKESIIENSKQGYEIPTLEIVPENNIKKELLLKIEELQKKGNNNQ